MIFLIQKVEGIILKESLYGDTSKIIQVLTKEYGLISVMCKGAKSPKSKLRASTLKFTHGVFDLYYKENKLSNLISVDVKDAFYNIRNDITLISFVSFLSELTLQVLKQNNHINLFDDLVATLKKIDAGFDPLILTNIIELKYLPFLGVGISLDGCAMCGNTKNIVTIDGDAGGFICKDCYTDERIVEAKTLKLLRMYYCVDIKSISDIKISDKIKNEINVFIDKYYDRYTGLYLKSKEFLKKIIDN